MASEFEYEKLLTPAQVGAIFSVDPKTVTRWAKAGRLTSIRTPGGHRRYREAEVRALLAGLPVPPVTPGAPAVPEVPAGPLASSLWADSGGIPAAIQRHLEHAGIVTVENLTAETAGDLAGLGLRPAQVDEVRLVLYRKGLALSGDVLGEVA